MEDRQSPTFRDPLTGDETLKGVSDIRLLARDSASLHSLIDQLQARLIEAELQNHELRASQEEIEKSRQMYIDIYDHAPVGQFTLDRNGLILQANLTAAELLGSERRRLVRKPLFLFVVNEFRDSFRARCREAVITRQRVTCEAVVKPHRSDPFPAQFDIVGLRDNDGEPLCYAALSDIAPRRSMEDRSHRERAALTETEKLLRKRVEDLEALLNERTETAPVPGPSYGAEADAAGMQAAHAINNSVGGIKNVFLLLRNAVPAEHPYHRYLPLLDEEIKRIGEAVRRFTDRAAS